MEASALVPFALVLVAATPADVRAAVAYPAFVGIADARRAARRNRKYLGR